MKTTWTDFADAVTHAGLYPKSCHAGDGCHWQITGGKQLVNLWPNTKRGCRMAVDNGRGRPGTIAKAIELAGPPKVPEPQAEKKYPASVPENPLPPPSREPSWEPQRVGLIRWLLRWLW